MGVFDCAYRIKSLAEVFGSTVDWWVALLAGGLCFAIVYIFQTVGLFTIAKRAGYSNKWMAFIPFLNTYYIGVCGQKNRFFNLDTKIVAIVTAVLEFITLGVYILYFVALIKVTPYLRSDVLPSGFNAAHPELLWARWCFEYLELILGPLQIIYSLGLVVVLNCFFQTYSARRYFIFTLTSILFPPVQGILIFAVRNNKGMSYAEYVRAVQERMYRQYRNQQNFNQDPYNHNPYSNGYNQPQNTQYQQPPRQGAQNSGEPEDPFAEFGPCSGSTQSGDPFDEFKN